MLRHRIVNNKYKYEIGAWVRTTHVVHRSYDPSITAVEDREKGFEAYRITFKSIPIQGQLVGQVVGVRLRPEGVSVTTYTKSVQHNLFSDQIGENASTKFIPENMVALVLIRPGMTNKEIEVFEEDLIPCSARPLPTRAEIHHLIRPAESYNIA